jgi:effector-binding domain-containing protein
VLKLLIFLFFLQTNQAMATEEPEFTVIFQEDNFEIREYEPKIIAHVQTVGDFDDASSQGFKMLADFIFGNNTIDNTSKKISMTAPVLASLSSKKISMPAPVIAENNNNEWAISFVMPKEFTIETLPVPNNQDIKITTLPKEKFAVIVFSGLVRESNYNKKANLLNEFIKKKKLTPLSSIQIARYNPPWTLPFFRRKELLIKIN